METDEPGNASDPAPKHHYWGERHQIRKQGVAWYLSEIGWVGPEATTVLENELVPLRDLLNAVIADLGL